MIPGQRTSSRKTTRRLGAYRVGIRIVHRIKGVVEGVGAIVVYGFVRLLEKEGQLAKVQSTAGIMIVIVAERGERG